jgi:hypothetical protein|nr:MAG TPA: Lower collar protein [Caudoviricetes sp.]
MARYTTQVRTICETVAGLSDSVGYTDVETVLNDSWDKIFTAFPIYDEAHRADLCKKILRHYYMDEIAFETYGLWQLAINTKLEEIMPQYNSLYKASAEIINPLYNKSLARQYDGTIKGTNKDTRTDNLTDTASATTTATGTDMRTDNLTDTNSGSVVTKSDSKRTDALKAVTDNTSTSKTTSSASNNSSNDSFTSDTPQGSLSDVKAGKYMTNASIGKSTGSTSGNDKNDMTSNSTASNTGTVSNAGTDTVTDNRTLAKTGTVKNDSTISTTSDSTLSKTGTVVNDSSDSRTDAHTETVTGYEGTATYAELLKKYSDAIINIDMMIINDLSTMFMQIW